MPTQHFGNRGLDTAHISSVYWADDDFDFHDDDENDDDNSDDDDYYNHLPINLTVHKSTSSRGVGKCRWIIETKKHKQSKLFLCKYLAIKASNEPRSSENIRNSVKFRTNGRLPTLAGKNRFPSDHSG